MFHVGNTIEALLESKNKNVLEENDKCVVSDKENNIDNIDTSSTCLPILNEFEVLNNTSKNAETSILSRSIPKG